MASVDGLVSGMSTSQVISQLMQVEAAGQTQLKSKVTAEQKIITAYQSVNTKMSALFTATEALTKAETWQAVKATSSSTTVAASATAGATTGQLTFNVKNLAKAQVSTAVLDTTQPITTTGTLTLTGAGLTDPLDIAIDPADETPAGVAAAINAAATAAGAGVRATVVTTDQGTMLQLTAAKTGVSNGFSLTGLRSTLNTAIAPTDATVEIGDPLAGGYTISSASNTFTDAIPNVVFTVSKVENDVTIDVTADAAGLADKMQAMVDAANAGIDEIVKQSKYDPVSKMGGALTSDFTVRQLQLNTLSAISRGSTDHGSYSQFGLKLDSGGKLKFDREKFLAEYAKDPVKIEAAATEAATTLNDVADSATDKVDGRLTLAINHGNSVVKDLNKQVERWDVRLEVRKAALERQFASLEVALGKMKSQSSWLAGQIASLPTAGG